VSTADGVPVEAVGGAIIKAYSAFLGGTQYTDLSMDQAGTQIVSQIVASDGTDGLMLGQIPQFYGPDGVWEIWLSANNGPRVRAQALDTADLVSAGLDSIADAAATLDQADADHASIGQPSGLATLGSDGILTAAQRPPASTSLSALSDVNIASPADKDLLRYDSASSKWKNVSPYGAWQTLTLASGMVANDSANPPRARLEPGGLVRLLGAVKKSSGTFASQTLLLTLPAGFQTTVFQRFAVATSAAYTGYIEIHTTTDASTNQVLINSQNTISYVDLSNVVYVLS
jgi:hypothetical protein